MQKKHLTIANNLLWFKKKDSNRIGIERNILNLKRGIYEKPTDNIILNNERLAAFSLRSQARQRCPLSPLLLKIVLCVVARAFRQENIWENVQCVTYVCFSKHPFLAFIFVNIIPSISNNWSILFHNCSLCFRNRLFLCNSVGIIFLSLIHIYSNSKLSQNISHLNMCARNILD